MSPTEAVDVVALKVQRPHVDDIPEFPTRQTISLLWDRVFALQAQLTAADATITRLLAAVNANEAAVAKAQQTATAALLAGAVAPGSAGSSGTGTGGGLPGGGDGGGAAEGFAAAGPTGHDSGGLLSPVRAGQIVGGTAHEWSTLLAPVATQAIRDANIAEMLSRMIWHLREAGFTAGKQQNPSSAISGDKLTVEVDAVMRVYDVLSDRPLTESVDAHMNEVPLPHFVDDAGTPD